MSAILSFLGGGVFRAVWGEIAGWVKAHQEHKFELDRMKLEETTAAAQHERNMAAQRQQAELGYKTIAVQADADAGRVSMEAWRAAIEQMNKPTGIRWVDAWNGAMRPAFYSLAFFIVLLICFAAHWEITALQAAGIIDLVFSICGFLFADRSLIKRGK